MKNRKRGHRNYRQEKPNKPQKKRESDSTNDLEYAEGTHLLIEKDTHEQMCGRIGNYDISTETRELKIQWGKVEML